MEENVVEEDKMRFALARPRRTRATTTSTMVNHAQIMTNNP